jgi:hypothetical protein
VSQHTDDWLYIMARAVRSIEEAYDEVAMVTKHDDPKREALFADLDRRRKLAQSFSPPAPWSPPQRRGWVGCDLDRTLAHYDRWRSVEHVGAPLGPMVERVRQVLAAGQYEVRVMTARVSPISHPPDSVRDARHHIELWCREQFGTRLEVTCEKDADMVELWDDRAVGVEPNVGTLLSPSRVLGQPDSLRLKSPGEQLRLPGTEPARPSRKRVARSTSRKTVARK